jgi:hypothetical protein
MSHSQFHSTNLFILRHAWLNLWDKHMTTGRINQVTTFQIHQILGSESHLSWQEFVSLIQNFLNLSQEIEKPPCSPTSHHSDAVLLVVRHDKNHALLRELPAISENARSRRILKCPIRNKTGHQQVVHIFPLPHCEQWPARLQKKPTIGLI